LSEFFAGESCAPFMRSYLSNPVFFLEVCTQTPSSFHILHEASQFVDNLFARGYIRICTSNLDTVSFLGSVKCEFLSLKMMYRSAILSVKVLKLNSTRYISRIQATKLITC